MATCPASERTTRSPATIVILGCKSARRIAPRSSTPKSVSKSEIVRESCPALFMDSEPLVDSDLPPRAVGLDLAEIRVSEADSPRCKVRNDQAQEAGIEQQRVPVVRVRMKGFE